MLICKLSTVRWLADQKGKAMENARTEIERATSADLTGHIAEIIDAAYGGRKPRRELRTLAGDIIELVDLHRQMKEQAIGGAIGGCFAMAAVEARNAAIRGDTASHDHFEKLAVMIEQAWPEIAAQARKFWGKIGKGSEGAQGDE